MPPVVKINGISSITDLVFEDQITDNLISFLDWSMLNLGGFFNVKRSNQSKSVLTHVKIPKFSQGQVWESVVGNWVWENNIDYPLQPTQISGVYVNNVFTTTGFYVDYRNGRIIFNSPINVTSKVEVEYSHRIFNFYDSDSDWFVKINSNPMDVESILSENRIHLPAVIIEVVGGTTFTPYQLGDRTVIEDQPILFHVISRTDEHRNKIVHILKRLYNETIWFYDLNKIARANKFPIDEKGSVVPNALKYPELVNQFYWKRCSFSRIIPQEITRDLPFFRSVIRAYLQVLMP